MWRDRDSEMAAVGGNLVGEGGRHRDPERREQRQ